MGQDCSHHCSMLSKTVSPYSYLNSNSEDKILKGSHQDIFDM